MNIETPTPFPTGQRMSEDICFDRKELGLILRLYGQMVAAGEWRDYGISTLRDLAVFSVFRRTAENPVYRIETRPKHQDLLRDYLAKLNYRVLMLSDLQRGLTRMRNNPVDSLLLMADSVSEGLSEGFQDFLRWKRTASTAALIVLSQKQSEWKTALEDAGTTRVLIQPIQLRDIRLELEAMLGKPG